MGLVIGNTNTISTRHIIDDGDGAVEDLRGGITTKGGRFIITKDGRRIIRK